MRKKRLPLLSEGQSIIAYRKGSGGVVLGIYYSVDELFNLERSCYPLFQATVLTANMRGVSKAYASFYHQCRVVLKVRNISEVKSAA